MAVELAESGATASALIAFEVSPDVRSALDAAGRTEDVSVSPDGSRLALACYSPHAIGLAEIEVERAGSEARVSVTGFELLRGSGLHEPHGVDFVTDDVVAVANRGGSIALFSLPEQGSPGQLVPWGDASRAPVAEHGPGSVRVRREPSGERSLLVCNNWVNTITRHALGADGVLGVGEVVAHHRLDLPDGLAVSGDGRWLAVSSHDSSTVLVFDDPSDGAAEPVCVLRGARCPHGLEFVSGGRRLLVADAGAPYVHVFDATGPGWSGACYPSASFRVLDDESFGRWRSNRYEGGPKGIDLVTDDVLVLTCEGTPLAFLDLARAQDDGTNDLYLGYEQHVLDEIADLQDAADGLRRELDAMRESKAWKLLERPREAYARVRRLRER
jgi:hypothetical protein